MLCWGTGYLCSASMDRIHMQNPMHMFADIHIITALMDTDWNILNWNIRGINDRDKWLALKDKIAESNCDVICIQQTKRGLFEQRYIHNFCSRSHNKFDYIPSNGAS